MIAVNVTVHRRPRVRAVHVAEVRGIARGCGRRHEKVCSPVGEGMTRAVYSSSCSDRRLRRHASREHPRTNWIVIALPPHAGLVNRVSYRKAPVMMATTSPSHSRDSQHAAKAAGGVAMHSMQAAIDTFRAHHTDIVPGALLRAWDGSRRRPSAPADGGAQIPRTLRSTATASTMTAS